MGVVGSDNYSVIADFISVELERGIPRLLIDFGSGTLELKVKPKRTLDDGEWHRLDIFWNTEVRIETRLERVTKQKREAYLKSKLFYLRRL